jgi:hypothetical protein
VRPVFLSILLLGLLATPVEADEETAAKIEYLLDSIGSSECIFIRNGKEHEAAGAEDHLRMKYRRGKKRVASPESFIKRIATKSSFSGKPYRIRCVGEEEQLTAKWLTEKLREYAVAI